ncbi:putative transmembrane protein [Mycobacterium xenopi]|uniref:Uncharacterized protein n=1 Tax=Mycobacterium xenopi TaxID=1789 RepID=A0AAD1H151_MYCXE|nr:hypothetical protein MYXE_23100 [Mycobacterium xenopi]SPX78394.1 putative transmembrane protein [Mycobacterium xenopi]
MGPLSQELQQGKTADDIREAHFRGIEHDRQVAEKSGVKKTACGSAHDSMLCLRDNLTNLAEDGNKEINDIKNSKQPTEAKVGEIAAVISQYRALANLAAAKYGGNLLDTAQSVLDRQGSGQSSREFAQSQGVEVGELFRQPSDENTLQQQVRAVLGNSGSTPGISEPGNNPGSSPGTIAGITNAPLAQVPASSGPIPGASMNAPGAGAAPPASPPTSQSQSPVAPGASMLMPAGGAAPPVPPPTSQPRVSGAPGASMSAPTGGAAPPAPVPPATQASPTPAIPTAPHLPTAPAMPTGGLPGAPSLPSLGAPSLPGGLAPPLSGVPLTPPTGAMQGLQGLTPANLMQSFNAGLQSGAPIAAAGDALPPPAPAAPEPQVPPTAPTTPMAGAGAPVPAFAMPPPVEHPPVPEAPSRRRPRR